jgi:hypothetical protein
MLTFVGSSTGRKRTVPSSTLRERQDFHTCLPLLSPTPETNTYRDRYNRSDIPKDQKTPFGTLPMQ